MRILIFSLAYYPVVGGAEVAIKELTDRLPDIEFDLVTLRFDKSHPAREKIGNVTVYRIGGGLGYLSKVLFVPDAAAFAVAMNRKRQYDLFWAMMTNMTFPIMVARLLGNRTPYVLTLQDGDPFERVFKRTRIKLVKPLLVSGFRQASVIQTISNFLAEWPRKMGYKGRIEMIPNGVGIERFQGEHIPHEGVVLITTSRLVEKNGVGDIISALPHLPDHVRLDILGVGPLEPALRQEVQKAGLGARVRFLGHVAQEDIPSHLYVADIFVRPSLSEGQGISFIEAMAAGLPVLATPVGGIPDFLNDGETGLFVNVHDPESIAEQVKRLMNDKALYQKLSENGKKLAVEKYDWNLIAEEMKNRVFEPFS